MGRLEIVTGPMFAEKSLELIKKAQELDQLSKHYIAFSPIKESIFSRAVQETIPAVQIEKEHPEMISYHAGVVHGKHEDLHTVFIDEVQFYTEGIISTITTLMSNGINVVVAGLDLTATLKPFGEMGTLLCIADKVIKKKTTCVVCGAAANRSQRLLNGNPAPFDAPTIIVDGSSAEYTYEPRCASCFKRG